MGTMTLPEIEYERGDLVVREGPFTVAERDSLPEARSRHELLEGLLVMSPAPRMRHQDIVGALFVLLKAAAPGRLKVLVAPFDVKLGITTVLEPDVLVARRIDLTEENLPTAPVLAVEVLSRSTALFDLTKKKDLLEAAGCPSYWVIDPVSPTLTAYELVDGKYVEVARVSDDESWTATAPYPVTIVPRDLLDD